MALVGVIRVLGLVEALIGALDHAVHLQTQDEEEIKKDPLIEFTSRLRRIIHRAMVEGKGTRDISGPEGLTTEKFVTYVAGLIKKTSPAMKLERKMIQRKQQRPYREASVEASFDEEGMRKFFESLDTNNDQHIDFNEFCDGMIKLGIYPRKFFADPASRPR